MLIKGLDIQIKPEMWDVAQKKIYFITSIKFLTTLLAPYFTLWDLLQEKGEGDVFSLTGLLYLPMTFCHTFQLSL